MYLPIFCLSRRSTPTGFSLPLCAMLAVLLLAIAAPVSAFAIEGEGRIAEVEIAPDAIRFVPQLPAERLVLRVIGTSVILDFHGILNSSVF